MNVGVASKYSGGGTVHSWAIDPMAGDLKGNRVLGNTAAIVADKVIEEIDEFGAQLWDTLAKAGCLVLGEGGIEAAKLNIAGHGKAGFDDRLKDARMVADHDIRLILEEVSLNAVGIGGGAEGKERQGGITHFEVMAAGESEVLIIGVEVAILMEQKGDALVAAFPEDFEGMAHSLGMEGGDAVAFKIWARVAKFDDSEVSVIQLIGKNAGGHGRNDDAGGTAGSEDTVNVCGFGIDDGGIDQIEGVAEFGGPRLTAVKQMIIEAVPLVNCLIWVEAQHGDQPTGKIGMAAAQLGHQRIDEWVGAVAHFLGDGLNFLAALGGDARVVAQGEGHGGPTDAAAVGDILHSDRVHWRSGVQKG